MRSVRKFSRYILRQLFVSAFLVSAILVGTLWIVQSLKFFDLVLKTQESLSSFLSLMLYALPDLLVIIIPLACFVAVLFVYNKLHSDRELSVLSAAGFSPWVLAKPALKFGLTATFLIYAINIFVLPWSFQKMRDLEYDLKKSLPGILLQEGVFNSFNDITIYVHEKQGNDLKGVLAYMQKDGGRPSTFLAKEGRLVFMGQTPQIVMVDGSRQEFDPQNKSLSVLYFDQTVVSLFEEQLNQAARPKKPYELTLGELLAPDFVVNFASKQRLYAEGYQRLLTPWYAFGFISVVLSFLLLTPFRRQAQTGAIFKSVMAVLALQVSCIFLINLGTHYWQALWGAYALMGMAITGCLFALREPKI